MQFQTQLIDLHQRRIYPAKIEVEAGKIKSIQEVEAVPAETGYILPGFVDAHVHVESSMLPPSEFARLAVVHGTVAAVSDPHEIANVLGIAGIFYMLENARKVPFHFCFGAPSCVPATAFETAGASLNANAVESLLYEPKSGYLSEMMNVPGVLYKDKEVMAKIRAARQIGKPVDGHAPGLRGEDAKTYFGAGISTDHECFTYEEAVEKANLGVKILIREGSAARNFDTLWPLYNEYPKQVMLCSDDKHPDDLVKGHINELVFKATKKGCDLFDVLWSACIAPVEHYSLPLGLLREGDSADFIRIADLDTFEVKETWIKGECVAKDGQTLLPFQKSPAPNHFKAKKVSPERFRIPSSSSKVHVIKVLDGEIVTEKVTANTLLKDGFLTTDPAQDILKIAVINRYEKEAPPSVAFVQGFHLKKGALASSVAHDSHNIVAAGSNDSSIAEAINAIIETKGGISATDGEGQVKVLPLPVAGLMSSENGYTLAKQYAEIDDWVKAELGCTLRAPFMTLSFLALPVIPALKITDKGLFDVGIFDFVPVRIQTT